MLFLSSLHVARREEQEAQNNNKVKYENESSKEIKNFEGGKIISKKQQARDVQASLKAF